MRRESLCPIPARAGSGTRDQSEMHAAGLSGAALDVAHYGWGTIGRTLEPQRLAKEADAVLLTLAPTGDHLLAVIAGLGLTEAITGKLQRFDTATLLNRHLAEKAGAGTLGFGPSTEILAWRGKGVAWAGAIPDEVQVVLPIRRRSSGGRRPSSPRARCSPSWRRPRHGGISSPAGSSEPAKPEFELLQALAPDPLGRSTSVPIIGLPGFPTPY